MFADDTNILITHSDLKSAERILNNELIAVSDWFKANKLSLNIDKTNFIIFHPFQKPISKIDIKIDNLSITSVHSTKFLGIIIDENLTFKPHICKVASTISKPIGILHKLKCFLSKDVLLSIYNSLILPHLMYCIIVWGNACPSYLNKINVLQKRAVRSICNVPYLHHSAPLFNDLKVFNIFNLFRYQLGIHMYKSINGMLPLYLHYKYTPVNSVHSYNTRNSTKLYQHPTNSSIMQKSIQFIFVVPNFGILFNL